MINNIGIIYLMVGWAIYVDGLPDHKINNDDIVDHLEKTVRQKVKELEMENKKIITKAWINLKK